MDLIGNNCYGKNDDARQRGLLPVQPLVSASLQLLPLADFPRVEPGDDLVGQLAESLRHNGLSLEPGDVLVIAQKIVSKAEDRYARLADIEPSARALELAKQCHKDPRQVELVLRESREVLRVRPGVMIVEHRNGYVHANAGIDRSNIPTSADDPRVLLLPENPDASAEQIRQGLATHFGIAPQVIINDSFGRAWRNGTVGIAIGCAGLAPVLDQIGETDLFGNVLEVTEPAVADELAAAASLVMGQAAQGCPVVLARGVRFEHSDGGSSPLLRERELDMFR